MQKPELTESISMETSQNSVTQWIVDLRKGDQQAAQHLWDRYFARLTGLARKRLANMAKRVTDEEDVTVSVFRRLCDGAANGRFDTLSSREDLWRLLIKITSRKVIDQHRHNASQKRGGGRIRGESVFAKTDQGDGPMGLDQFVAEEPSPEFFEQMWEEHRRLSEQLNDPALQHVARWRMEGFSNAEIATKLGLTTRSIERKMQRIRSIWETEL